MRLATTPTGVAIIAADETLVPLASLVRDAPKDMVGVILAGKTLWTRVRDAAAQARGGASVDPAALLAPIPNPRRDVFCVGLNYMAHVAEGHGALGTTPPARIPEHPALFSKGPNTVVGPEAGVYSPEPLSNQLDWEVELVVVMGAGGRNIPESEAQSLVFGYTVGNDVSVRDFQVDRHGGQWFKGKNFDTHMPMGPMIVTADELPDPHSLRITSRVNGVTKQDGNTRDMIYRIPQLIAELSDGMALMAGDLISTGTPEGVGFARRPPEFMKVGDIIEVEVERIGTLRNHIVRAPSSSVSQPTQDQPRVSG